MNKRIIDLTRFKDYYKGVCTTAPATPGVLIGVVKTVVWLFV